jgi:heptosyltransferase-2
MSNPKGNPGLDVQGGMFEDPGLRDKFRRLADMQEQPVKIFIRGLNWIGDAIISTPAIRMLRQTFQQAHITLMVRPWVASVYENNPDIDDLWIHDDASSRQSFLKAVSMVRKGRFQIGIAFPNSFRSALLMNLGRIKLRVGYRQGARSILLNQAMPVSDRIKRIHQVYYYLQLLSPFCQPPPRSPQLVLTPGELEREEVRQLIQQHGLDRGQTLIGLAPGAINSDAKRWPTDKYAELATRLGKQPHAEIILLGSSQEKSIIERVASQTQARTFNFTGQLSLGQAIALIEQLNGLICNDSGAMHIAAALKVPTVAVFGPTEWNTTYPFSRLSTIVRKEGIECAPCMLRNCPIDHRCMVRIGIDDVLKSFRQIILDAKDHRNQPKTGNL